MKKIFLFILLCLPAIVGFTQDSVQFKMTYNPLHIYNMSFSQKMDMKIFIEGSDSIVKKMKDNGVDNPLLADQQTDFSAVITTGEIKNNIFPVSLKLIKSLSSYTMIDKHYENIMPPGTTYVGTDTLGKLPAYDSIISDSLDENKKKELLKTIKNIAMKITAPDKKMGVGEEYTQNVSLALPVLNKSIKMNMAIVYKLISISDATAKFDLKMKIGMVEDMLVPTQSAITGNGDGNGNLIYDIKNEFPLKEDIHFVVSAFSTIEGIPMKISLVSNSSHSYIIQSR